MRGRGQAADTRGVLRVVGVEPEFEDAVLAPHLLIIPVVIAVVELREISVALEKPSLLLGDRQALLWRGTLPRYSGLLAKPRVQLELHAGARDAEGVIGALPDRVKPLVEIGGMRQ